MPGKKSKPARRGDAEACAACPLGLLCATRSPKAPIFTFRCRKCDLVFAESDALEQEILPTDCPISRLLTGGCDGCRAEMRMTMKIRYRREPPHLGHAHVTLFAGLDAEHLANCGQLVLQDAEFEALRHALRASQMVVLEEGE